MARNMDILDLKHTFKDNVPEKINNSLITGIHKIQVEYAQDPQMQRFKIYMPGDPHSVDGESDNEGKENVNETADADHEAEHSPIHVDED